MASYSTLYLSQLDGTTGSGPPPPWAPSIFRGGWDKTTPYQVIIGTGGQGGEFRDDTNSPEAVATNPYRVLLLQVLIGPLEAQTLSGTVDLVAGVAESDAAANFYWAAHLWVSQGQTNALRGTALNQYAENTTNEWVPTATGTAFQSPQALSGVVCQQGDYLIAELGYIARNGSASSFTGTIWHGSVGAGILLPAITVGSTAVTTKSSVMTFSNPLVLYEPSPVTGDVIASNNDLFVYDGVTGVLKRRIGVPRFWEPAGGAQDAAGNFYVAEERTPSILQYDPTLTFVTSWSAAPGELAHAISANQLDTLFVGFGGSATTSACGDGGAIGHGTPTARAIRAYATTGVAGTVIPVDADRSGSNAIDLAADQTTMFYTSLGREIKRINVASGLQLTDFATLPGVADATHIARGIRVLPDGGVIVADAGEIKRLDGAGVVTQTYNISGQFDWGTLGLPANAQTFWAANTANSLTSPPMIAQFNLTTGAVVTTITGDSVPDTSGFLCSGGITIWNGYRAGTSTIVPLPDVPPYVSPSYDVRERIIRRLRRGPILWKEDGRSVRLFLNSIQFDFQAGVGLVTGQGSDPVCLFRLSYDGGATWADERQLPLGKMGDYLSRCIANNCGSGYNLVAEVVVTDPVAAYLAACYVDIEAGLH